MSFQLTPEQLEKFRATGILVVEGVFDSGEVQAARAGLQRSLATYGVDHGDLETTGHNLRKLSSTSGAGGVLDLFYADWKFELMENPKLFSVLSQLWGATYASESSRGTLFQHPYGDFNPQEGYYYVDRVGYRVPESISALHSTGKNKSKPLQRSLTPHLDCCANNLYGNVVNIEEKLRRWRPIQAFVALTPNLERNTGGFEAVPGFHKEFTAHFSKEKGKDRDAEPQEDPEIGRICIGEFSPLVPKFDGEVLKRFQHIEYSTGSVVCWDWRTPHANAQANTGKTPREVVYTGFLPNIEVNRRFAAAQLQNYQNRELPNHVWHHHKYSDGPQEGLSYEFSPLGRHLMGLNPWNS